MDAAYKENMASEMVKKLISQNISEQWASDDVQAQVASTIDEKWESDEVKKMVSDAINEQMGSAKVQRIIQKNIEDQKTKSEYLNAVADALEENGRDGEAYHTLADLMDQLSDVEDFYQGILDYTEAVGQAATEVLRVFHMDDFTDLPEEDVAAHFLAIHLLVSSRVAVGDGFAFADIARDIADDGLWNDSAARASVADWALRADAEDAFAGVRKWLSDRAPSVPGFEKYLRLFYQKELGIPECSSENAGTMLHVGNVASRYFVTDESDFSKVSERFTCNAAGGIELASESLKDVYAFGEGKAGEVRQGPFTKNRYYTYSSSKNAWVPSTEVEKDSYFVQMSATSTFTDIKDVYEGIKPNERVIFVLRHAERGDDTSKGGSLTDNGKAQSKAVGEKLIKFEDPFLLGGSEFKRAHQTVEYIAKGRGQQSDVRDTFPELNDDWYTFSQEANDKAKSDCNCGGWELTSKYAYTGAYTSGDKAAFYALDERSVELIVDVLLAKYNDPTQRFVMLSSHDKVMVPLVVYCTQGKVNLKKHDGGKWLNYLAGVAIIIDELGNRRYVPVKGLDSAYM
jgi:broad specificity phosphatase PhoE